MDKILTGLLFILIFGIIQGIIFLISGTTPTKEAKKNIEKIKNSDIYIRFIYDKQVELKRMGAGVLLKDYLTVSQWYLYKLFMATLFGAIAFFITAGLIHSNLTNPSILISSIIGWFFLDIILKIQNKASNDEMMPDIMEMSRSVLYGKRGGQFISDALRDSIIVVENKRLKTALMRLRNELDSGLSLDECLDELEHSFSNGEISSFCTVIKSLQSTGQVDDALRTLENNIEREQNSVNKRRCMMLEHKTMMYVILIAMDLMMMILYCIIMKLLAMQIGF